MSEGRCLLDLPDEEMSELCRCLGRVRSFGMNHGATRIADMGSKKSVADLSPKMRHALIRIGHRFRRQLPAHCLRFFLRFSSEELASRLRDHTWQMVEPKPTARQIVQKRALRVAQRELPLAAAR